MENVATILEKLPLSAVCRMLYIPDAKLDAIKSEFSTDKERLIALIQLWLLGDLNASWRRLIIRLDSKEALPEAEVNSIRNYAEKLTGQ